MQCGKAVRVMVDHCPEGWKGVVRFVEDRERQNREELLGSRPKNKGVRELQKLESSINYEKIGESKAENHSSSRGGRKGGIGSCFKRRCCPGICAVWEARRGGWWSKISDVGIILCCSRFKNPSSRLCLTVLRGRYGGPDL